MKKVFIAVNIFYLFIILLLLKYDNIPTRIKIRSGHYHYTNNDNYEIRRSLFKTEGAPAKIVIIGTSLTAFADWSKILDKYDVANRGIGADVTDGMLARLDDVYSLRPSVCVVEGGINDFGKLVSVERIAGNLVAIYDSLRAHGITPISNSILPYGKRISKSEKVNRKIAAVNSIVERHCKAAGIRRIDLGPALAKDGYFDPRYTLDGVHLTGNAYAIWRDSLKTVLPK